MSDDPLWRSERQFERLQPLVPTDLRRVAQSDDRRKTFGIAHVL